MLDKIKKGFKKFQIGKSQKSAAYLKLLVEQKYFLTQLKSPNEVDIKSILTSFDEKDWFIKSKELISEKRKDLELLSFSETPLFSENFKPESPKEDALKALDDFEKKCFYKIFMETTNQQVRIDFINELKLKTNDYKTWVASACKNKEELSAFFNSDLDLDFLSYFSYRIPFAKCPLIIEFIKHKFKKSEFNELLVLNNLGREKTEIALKNGVDFPKNTIELLAAKMVDSPIGSDAKKLKETIDVLQENKVDLSQTSTVFESIKKGLIRHKKEIEDEYRHLGLNREISKQEKDRNIQVFFALKEAGG